MLNHTATESGTYGLRVFGDTGTEGEYFIKIDGATGANPSPEVTGTNPINGAVLGRFPSTLVLDFSEQMLASSLDDGDLLVGGMPTLGFTVLDADSIEFQVDPAANIGETTYAVQLLAGAVADLQGNGNVDFNGGFVLDVTGPNVVSTLWNGRALPVDTVITGETLSFEATLNEAIRTELHSGGTLKTPGTDDITLVNNTTSESFVATSTSFDTGTNTFSAEFAGLTDGAFTLTLISADEAFEDEAGNDLDGEPVGPGIDGTPSGNSIPGGDYFVNFQVDRNDIGARQFARLQPLGSLMSVSQSNRGMIHLVGDLDDYTFFVEVGHAIAASAQPDNDTVTMTIELLGLSTAIATPGPGEKVILPPTPVPEDGVYALRVSGDGLTAFALDIFRNASLEDQVGDSEDGNELPIDASFVDLGSGRFGVVGTSITSTTDALVWGVQPATGEIIDPTTGLVVGSFPAPGNLLPGDTDIGLSIAEDGSSLFRLDPNTGAVLNTVSLTSDPLIGLGVVNAPSASADGTITIPDIDEYEVDLIGKVGESIDVILAGQDRVDFSGGLLELLDSGGRQLAIGQSDPLGVDATNYDLGILDFIVPADDTYTLRLTSTVDGDYGLNVTDRLTFDIEPNDVLADPLRILNTGTALGFLGGGVGNRLFGVDAATSEIVEFDVGSGAELNRFATPELASGGPDGLAFDGTSLFFFNEFGSETLFELDPDTGAVLDSDSEASLGMGGAFIDGLGAVGGLLTALDLNGQVFFLNTDSDSVVGSWTSPVPIVGGIAGAGSRGTVFVSDSGTNHVHELASATGDLVNTLPSIPGASIFGIGFVKGNLYTGHKNGIINVIDPDSGTILNTFTPLAGLSALGGDDASGAAPFFTASSYRGPAYYNSTSGNAVGNFSVPNEKLVGVEDPYEGTGQTSIEVKKDTKPDAFHPAAATAYLPVGVSQMDLAAQLTLPPTKPATGGEFTNLTNSTETEPNDTIATANSVPLGFDSGEDFEVDVAGSIAAPPSPTPLDPSAEDEGSIPLATPTGLVAGDAVIVSSTIGDGPFGSAGTGSGDFDFYQVTATSAGQMITVDVNATAFGRLDSFLALYDSSGTLLAANDDDGGSLDSFLSITVPAPSDYFISIGGFESTTLADPFDSSSGLGVGSEGPYDVTIGLDNGDIDFFRVELDPGDIFGANVNGGATLLTLRDSSGSELVGSDQDVTFNHPSASPLPGGGNAALSWVVDTAGDYYVGVSGGPGAYKLNLRLFRPALEGEILGTHQILFLDFDGATIDTSIFGAFGSATLSALDSFLPDWGLDPVADLDAVIDAIVASVEENLSTDIRLLGNHGDFDASGTPGQFDIEILNSRDDADPFGLPNVSRVIVGGSIVELGITTVGIAESIDVGNFETEESAVVLLDLLSGPASEPDSLNQYALDPSVSITDLIGVGVGNLTAHEAGHFFADWHTDPMNPLPNIMDQGGNLDNTIGLVGPVWGDGDEIDVDFGEDTYVPSEGFTGTEDTLNAIAFGLSTGTIDPALVGPTMVSIAPPPGRVDDLNIAQVIVEFSEQVTAASAEDPGNYLFLEVGPNGMFEAGAGDDGNIPVTPMLDGSQSIVTLAIDAAFSPLALGLYQLTIDGDSSIEDQDGNPLNSTTGPGGGSDHVHEFEVVFDLEAGGDLYTLAVTAGELVSVSTQTPFDDPSSSPLNDLDPKLLVLGPEGLPVAEDSDSGVDGKNALIRFLASVSGTYTVQVVAESGTGEYLLNVNAAPPQVGDMDFDGDVDFDDVDSFVKGLVDPAGYELQYGVPPAIHGDTDGDNDLDFDDIVGFVVILSGGTQSESLAVELGEPQSVSRVSAVTLTNSTVSGNSTKDFFSDGGGISNGNAPIVITNSIVSGNTAGGGNPDLDSGTGVLDVDYSLLGDTSGLTAQQFADINAGTGNLLNRDPLLSPLSDNGGPIQTHALFAGSPAIDMGDPSFTPPPDFDQRGAPFARVVDGGVAGLRIDMGATERQSLPGLILVVDTAIDENDGDYTGGDLSLREAIGLANVSAGVDMITFNTGVFNSPGTIALLFGEMQITEAVTINGPGQHLLTIDAEQNSRIFNVDDGTSARIDVSLSGLTLTGGNSGGAGGAIRSRENLTVTGSSITGNSAGNSFPGGGIESSGGSLTISGVLISNNSAGVGGGVAVTDGDASFTGSTISGNTAFDGDGGGIYSFFTDLTITQSTISGNVATGGSRGGGVFGRNGPTNITDSTISGNEARGGPAIGGGVYITGGHLSITGSTISGNSAHSNGGGIAVAPDQQTTAAITHTTIAGNQAD